MLFLFYINFKVYKIQFIISSGHESPITYHNDSYNYKLSIWKGKTRVINVLLYLHTYN